MVICNRQQICTEIVRHECKNQDLEICQVFQSRNTKKGFSVSNLKPRMFWTRDARASLLRNATMSLQRWPGPYLLKYCPRFNCCGAFNKESWMCRWPKGCPCQCVTSVPTALRFCFSKSNFVFNLFPFRQISSTGKGQQIEDQGEEKTEEDQVYFVLYLALTLVCWTAHCNSRFEEEEIIDLPNL